MPKSLFTVWVFIKINVRRYFRDQIALFFTVVFPLIFLIIFGFIFGRESKVSFNVALVNQSNSQFSQQFSQQLKDSSVFKVKPGIDSLEAAQLKMKRSELDATIVLPPDFGGVKDGLPTGQAIVYYDQNNEQGAQTLTTILKSVLDDVNKQLAGNRSPLTVQAQSTNQNGLSRFDYTFAGLVGFSIIGLGIFGPINVFPELKKTRHIKETTHNAPQSLAILCIKRNWPSNNRPICHRRHVYSGDSVFPFKNAR